MHLRSLLRPPVLLTILLVAGLAAWLGAHTFWTERSRPLVLYCAHDAQYSEAIIRAFTQRTGIRVEIRFDTEATKSLGLAELIQRERDHPRCDVFWNNQMLTTTDLAEQGLFEPYQGPGWQRISPAYRDPQGRWGGFAGRLRVYIVNTQKLAATPEAVAQALTARDLSRVAIAKPLYGTTLTHYAVLADVLGLEKLKAWHADWRQRGVREVPGNAAVKNLVAQGVCDLGLTDSDDYFEAKDDGAPVAAVPVRVGDGKTILIPNTVAIIKGAHRPADARQLADFLLSKECELLLAKSPARQVPLGPVPPEELPADVRMLQGWAGSGYPLAGLGPVHQATLAWLKAEYLR